MMMKILIAISFSCCLLTSPALSQGKYWKEYYRRERVEPSNVEYLCKVSLDQHALESHLRDVGGPWKNFKPSINWAEDIPIIIAPNTAYADFDLAVQDVVENGDKFKIQWGWWNSSKQRWIHSSQKSKMTEVSTVGTQKRQILIVIVKRNLFIPTNNLTCGEL